MTKRKDFWSFWQRFGRWFLLGAGLGFLLLGFFLVTRQSAQPVEFLPAQEEEKKEITVDISGAVVQPGVYHLPLGTRVGEAIKTAGGLNSEADSAWIEKNLNLARPLTDGEKLYLPRKGEAGQLSTQSVLGQSIGKININLASQAELEQLPGIGPGLAKRIIDYRQSHGGFKTIEEIMAVPGIGPRLFSQIKDQIAL